MRAASLQTAAVVAVVLLDAACGRKTAPRPPQLVRPQVIERLTARNTQDGILLSWKRPERYVDRSRMNDLAGFRVERSIAGAAFTVIAQLEVTDRDRFRPIRDFHYLDTAVTEGESYRYRVLSFTLDGYVSEPSEAVEINRSVPAAQPDAPAP